MYTSASPQHRQRSAFTLLELSIVIVVIGLLVGGVLVGKDMVRAAELRSIAKDWEKFEAARIVFKNKYNCIPGDCANATQFGLGNNGNGNYRIDYPGSSVEHLRYFVHLGNSGLISGNYSDVPASGGNQSVTIGTNVPASSASRIGYSIYVLYPNYNPWGNFMGIAGSPYTHFYITGAKPTNNWQTMGAAFTVLEAQSVDAKFDDGIASTGKIRSHKGYVPYATDGCHNSVWPGNSSPNFDYNLASANGMCSLAYLFEP